MCPAREVTALAGIAKRGVSFLGGTASLGTQRRGTKKDLKDFLFVLFFVRSKAKYQKKSRPQLGLRLSSRNTLMRGRHELIPLLAGLKQRGALIRIHVLTLGYAATGF